MDLPSFAALNASGTLSVQTTSNPANPNGPGLFSGFQTQTGDPTLRPTMSNNFDLSFEWYPHAGTTFHVAAFYKRITDLTVYSAAVTPVTITTSNGTPVTANVITTNAHNAPAAATVKGVEVGGRTFFDKLPGVFSGLGVEANFTYIDSKSPGDTYIDIFGNTRNDLPLQGLSKYNFNVSLLYERNPFSVRVAYSWRSKYLQSTNANGTNQTYTYYAFAGDPGTNVSTDLPVYGDATGSLDAGVTVKVTKNFSFDIEGQNLANETTRTLMGGNPADALHIRSWFQSDRRIRAGLKFAF
jgi:TonB-dependent receptor